MTAERMIQPAVAPPPSTSLALVPLRSDSAEPGPVRLPDAGAMGVHRAFFGMWYLGVALLPMAAWVGVWSWDWNMALIPLGVGMLILGGMGVAVRTLFKPRMQKLRQALGAGAALTLSLASLEPVRDAAMEVCASGVVAKLEPMAAELARDGRIRAIGRNSLGWVSLNGFAGQDNGPDVLAGRSPGLAYGLELQDVLIRDGIPRAEYTAWMDRLRGAGIMEAEVRPGYVAFRREEHGRWMLLYVRPGHVLPRRMEVMDRQTWRTEPLGGGWYLMLPGPG
jgi:hypothetical protein